MTDTTRCDFRDERSCSCEPGECRVSPQPIRTTKANDMRGVFSPRCADYLVFIAAFLAVISIGLTITELRDNEQQYQIARRV